MFADPADDADGTAAVGGRRPRRARHAAADLDVASAGQWSGGGVEDWPVDAPPAPTAQPPRRRSRHRRVDPADPAGQSDGAGQPGAGLTGRSAGARPSAVEPAAGSPGPGSPHPAAGGVTATFGALPPDHGTWLTGEEPPPADTGRHEHPGRRRAHRVGGRSGRNLPAAIGVGVLLGVLVLGSLTNPLAFAVVVALAAAAGVWEMVRAVRVAGIHAPLPPLLMGAALIPILGFLADSDGLAIGLLVTVLAAVVWRLGDGPGGYQRDIPASALIAVYVPFLLGYAAPLAHAPDGVRRVLLTLVVVVLSDTGGYAVGARFGRHPMAPAVSPHKSWEGLGGSLAAAGIGGLAAGWLLLGLEPWQGALFGVVVAGTAVVGDLTESMIKRDLGVKDMSRLLPGHGGLMDRLDSIIFAVPTAYLLLSLLGPATG